MILYPTPADDDEITAIALDSGYLDIQPKGDAGLCAIAVFLYTHAILSNLNRWGYEGRWCYHTYGAAKAALDAWDGADGTEPAGWHKDAVGNRRRDAEGNSTTDEF